MLTIDLFAAPPSAADLNMARLRLTRERRSGLVRVLALLGALCALAWGSNAMLANVGVVLAGMAMALALAHAMYGVQFAAVELDALGPASDAQLRRVRGAAHLPLVAAYVNQVRGRHRQLVSRECATIEIYARQQQRDAALNAAENQH